MKDYPRFEIADIPVTNVVAGERLKDFSIPVICPACKGEQTTKSGDPCYQCDGEGTYDIIY